MNELYLAAALGLVLAGEWLYRSGGSRAAQAVGLAALLAAIVCLPAALSEPAAVRAVGAAVYAVAPWVCLLAVPATAVASWRRQWPRPPISWWIAGGLAAAVALLLGPYWTGSTGEPLTVAYSGSAAGGLVTGLSADAPPFLRQMTAATLLALQLALYAAIPAYLGLILVWPARPSPLWYAGVALLAFGALVGLDGLLRLSGFV